MIMISLLSIIGGKICFIKIIYIHGNTHIRCLVYQSIYDNHYDNDESPFHLNVTVLRCSAVFILQLIISVNSKRNQKLIFRYYLFNQNLIMELWKITKLYECILCFRLMFSFHYVDCNFCHRVFRDKLHTNAIIDIYHSIYYSFSDFLQFHSVYCS